MSKALNHYTSLLPAFDATPKAIYAALALSLALRLSEDDVTAARELLSQEWSILHSNGLVPQKPREQA